MTCFRWYFYENLRVKRTPALQLVPVCLCVMMMSPMGLTTCCPEPHIQAVGLLSVLTGAWWQRAEDTGSYTAAEWTLVFLYSLFFPSSHRFTFNKDGERRVLIYVRPWSWASVQGEKAALLSHVSSVWRRSRLRPVCATFLRGQRAAALCKTSCEELIHAPSYTEGLCEAGVPVGIRHRMTQKNTLLTLFDQYFIYFFMHLLLLCCRFVIVKSLRYRYMRGVCSNYEQ